LKKKRGNIRNEHGAGQQAAEFAPALMVFFMFFFFPMLDLFALGIGMASVTLIARQSANRAATSSTLGQAMQTAAQESYTIASSGIGHFLNLQPQGGIVYNGQNSGVQLYVQVTQLTGGSSTQTYGPYGSTMSALVPATDISSANINNYVFEYSSQVTYNVGPLLNMAAIPFIGNCPGLGRPMTVNFASHCAAEYPDGLDNLTIPAAAGSGS
jgi:hypothetical protein